MVNWNYWKIAMRTDERNRLLCEHASWKLKIEERCWDKIGKLLELIEVVRKKGNSHGDTSDRA